MVNVKDKLLVILGPTATGKTDIAIEVAKRFNGELISCDSRQVYTGLDIGTGKLPGGEVEFKKFAGYWIIDQVKVHLYDIADPKEQFNAVRYADLAKNIITQIKRQKRLPIIVGGTGLYLKVLLNGLSNFPISTSPDLREELARESLIALQKKLSTLSPSLYQSLNPSEKKNKRRLIRKIEIVLASTDHKNGSKLPGISKDFDILKIGMTSPRSLLYKRIDERVVKRVDQGMIEEGRKLVEDGLSTERMRQFGLEYKFLADLIEGGLTEEEFIKKLQLKIHQFAKRQLTWFKREDNVHWIDISQPNFTKKVEKLVNDWYN